MRGTDADSDATNKATAGGVPIVACTIRAGNSRTQFDDVIPNSHRVTHRIPL
jgi:hypothetical protein